MGWRPLLRVLSGIVFRLWCGSSFWDVTGSFFLRCLLASAAPAERYFATQLLGMAVFWRIFYGTIFPPTLSGVSSDRVGVMGTERFLTPGVACCCNTH